MKTMVSLIIAVLMASPAFAGFFDDNPVPVSASLAWRSQYVLTAGSVAYEKPVIQADVMADLRGLLPGLYADIWASVPANLQHVNGNYGTEVDYTVGLKRGLMGGVAADVGVSYFDLKRVFDGRKDDLVRPYLRLDRPLQMADDHTLTPYAGIDWYIPAKGGRPEGGFDWFIGACHTWKLTKELTFSWGGDLLWDDGACGKGSGWVLRGLMGFGWKLCKGIRLEVLDLRVWTPLTTHDARRTEWVWGSCLAVSF